MQCAYAYRKDERLRKNSDFLRTMKGKRLSIDGLSLFYAKNETGRFKVGISVSKKLAGAVKRNKLRRRIRNCLMKTLAGRPLGYDLVFVARQGLSEASYEQISKTVETILDKTIFRIKEAEGPGL